MRTRCGNHRYLPGMPGSFCAVNDRFSSPRPPSGEWAGSEADWRRERLKPFEFFVNTVKDGTFSLPQSFRDSSLIRGSLVGGTATIGSLNDHLPQQLSGAWENPGVWLRHRGSRERVLERREVEKRIYGVRKEAAHGFRNLSVIKILFGFEHRIKELKTKNDEIMNGFLFPPRITRRGRSA